MFIRNHPIIATLGLLSVAVGAYGTWIVWPLLVFLRGEPVFYPPDALRSVNRGAAETLIVGGTLVDGAGGPPLENAAILIRGDRIVDVGPADRVHAAPGAVTIPAAGRTILPGLVDLHVHLNKGDDLQLFLAAGVTTVRDVGAFTSQIVPLAKRTRSNEIVGPRIFYSGESFIHESGFAQWQRPTRDADDARAEVKKRIADGASVIKIVSDITPELVQAIVEEAHRAHVPVTADVLGNGVVTAERAIQLGVDGLEHVSGVPQSIQSDAAPTRSAEPVSPTALMAWMYADPQKEAALIRLMVERGTYIVPTFVVMSYFFPDGVPVPADPAEAHLSPRLRGLWAALDRLPSFSAANDRASETGFLLHFAYSQPFVKKFAAAGGRIGAGTDEPTPGLVPGFSLHRELELLVAAGLTPQESIRAATTTAADILGQREQLGTIAPGRLADLILVEGQPHLRISDIRNVRTVVKNGIVMDTADILRLTGGR